MKEIVKKCKELKELLTKKYSVEKFYLELNRYSNDDEISILIQLSKYREDYLMDKMNISKEAATIDNNFEIEIFINRAQENPNQFQLLKFPHMEI